MTSTAFSATLMVAALLSTTPVQGQSGEAMASDLLHADLPLFGHGGDDEWPQRTRDEQSTGCGSRVVFGDWIFQRLGTEVPQESWYRFANQGVFHCWANTFRAGQRAALDGAERHPSFFVLLGTTRVDDTELELWAIQIGAVPGSDYLLLSRAPSDELVDAFHVLQTACPRASVRDAGSLDVLLTRYCTVNSRRDLSSLARRMARRPPLGTLTHVPTEASR
jgi:hypothetical protein